MRIAAAACIALAGACSAAPQAPVPGIEAHLWERMVAAEDARAADPAQLALLRSELSSQEAAVRAQALRALGRTERAELRGDIAPLLTDAAERVRIAAAHAVADVSRDSSEAPAARQLLLNALEGPDITDAAAGAVAESLGRLHTDASNATTVVAAITPLLESDGPARLGALRGLYFLARRPAARGAIGPAGEALRRAAADTSNPHARVLAVSVAAATGTADEFMLAVALRDDDAQVRREAATATAALSDTSAVARLSRHALADTSAAVRYDGIRTWARRLASTHGCDPVLAAVHDAAANVSLLAIDLLGSICRSISNVALLDSIADSSSAGWHHAAHATVALALTDASRAAPRVEALALHSSPFARAWSVVGARALRDAELLRRLAADSSVNVRTAAVSALAEIIGHAADSVYAAQLESTESELLMAAAAALEGTALPGVDVMLLDALDRVTALRMETSRDGRMALLERIGQLGNAAHADRLGRYVRDFDPVVAARAAEILTTWTGRAFHAAPQSLAPQPLPTFAEATAIAGTTYVIEMDDGREIRLGLLPFDAPTNAARFARLARSGHFDGLTIHRVVPAFVVQGGSPGANEYSGDGPYTRDELGVPNLRGTVGLSTRGRDTGDGQFFINLIDNVRLDHDYTVFGIVMDGMDVVDSLLEGAVIRRVREER